MVTFPKKPNVLPDNSDTTATVDSITLGLVKINVLVNSKDY